MKRLLTVLLGSMLTVSIGAHAKEWSTIRFGVDASYPPFESKAPDSSLVGFDIDVGNELCRRLNAKCVWVENAFDGMIPGLKSRKFDGVLFTMSMTPTRVKQIAFSSKLFHVPTRLVAKRDSNIQPTAESLAGKAVGVEQGSMQETYAKVHWGAKGVKGMSYADQVIRICSPAASTPRCRTPCKPNAAFSIRRAASPTASRAAHWKTAQSSGRARPSACARKIPT